MRRNYNRDLFKNIEELQQSISDLKGTFSDYKIQAEIRIAELEDTVSRQENEIDELKSENNKLRKDNERLKRRINNNSSNSSLPPSSDQKPSKPANTYNGRQKTGKPAGGQPGHPGKTLTKERMIEMIESGDCIHTITDTGEKTRDYVSRFVIDIKPQIVITEIRIHADEENKFVIPEEYNSSVIYGNNFKSLCIQLYTQGVCSYRRIAEILSEMLGNRIEVSEGTVVNICKEFSKKCERSLEQITTKLLDSEVLYTDSTVVTLKGVQAYIRNQSIPEAVLYSSMNSKSIEALEKLPVVNNYTGAFMHDHETALYHFGTSHAECGAHILRYLRKNSEETGHKWSDDMQSLLLVVNQIKKENLESGAPMPSETDIWPIVLKEYNEILEAGRCENKTLKFELAKEDEIKLLNRLEKFKDNHLLFATRKDVDFTNNLSERDLRKCKNRQKMSGGFRTEDGKHNFCRILSVYETLKRCGKSGINAIKALFEGSPIWANEN